MLLEQTLDMSTSQLTYLELKTLNPSQSHGASPAISDHAVVPSELFQCQIFVIIFCPVLT